MEHFGQVPQVEGVVAFGRRGQHLGLDGVVAGNARIYQLLAHAFDGLITVCGVDNRDATIMRQSLQKKSAHKKNLSLDR